MAERVTISLSKFRTKNPQAYVEVVTAILEDMFRTYPANDPRVEPIYAMGAELARQTLFKKVAHNLAYQLEDDLRCARIPLEELLGRLEFLL